MTPDRWKQVDELYHAALDLEVHARADFLRTRCADDETLLREVEALLLAHARAGDFIDTTALNDLARAAAGRSSGQFEGRQINQYQIVSRLGTGGMGEVYRAHDSRLERDVAIKVLPTTGFDDPTGSLRLIREARTASKLNHPNICTIHEVGEASGQTFIAMELVDGEPLSRCVPLKADEVIRYGLQLADALGHAHFRGIVHRDFKSANVMITPEGRAKVLDFGLAKSLKREDVVEVTAVTHASLTQQGLVVGTLPYMAPEQLRGHSADARSDVWALGVVLYEMASGVRPFSGETTLDLSSAILAKPVPSLPSTVPAKLQSAIVRCLEKDPANRYADGTEVHKAIQQIQDTRTIALPLIDHVASHRRAYTYAALLGVVLLLVGGGAVLRRFNNTPSEAFLSWQPLTHFIGWEVAPSWSSDGNLIAYSHIVNSSADIAILPIRGGDPRVLTADSPADEFLPRFSPDGSKILFASDRGSGTNIYWIPFVGGTEHLVVETGIPFLQLMGAWAAVLGSNPWSNDGSEIVFSRLEATGEVALWKFNFSTRKETKLTSPPPGTEDGGAAWSPDGKQIAFTRAGSVWVVSPDGGEPSVLVENAADAAWKPDSHGLVFSSARSGVPNIWDMDLGTGKLRQLTSGRGEIWPVVARDGTIAYSEFEHEVNVYWTSVGGAAGEPEQLTSFTGESFGPRISLDGSQVLYYSNRTGNYEVWILDRKNGADQNLTDSPDSADRLADWSPDGKEIVFMSDRGGSIELWIAKTAGGPPRQLTRQKLSIASHTAEAEGGPRWAPDGKLIAYLAPVKDGSAIWVADPQGVKVPQETSIRNAISFGWYKDSRRLLYIRRSGDGSGLQELVAADISTGEEKVLLRRPIAELAVAADGGALSFIHAVSHFTMDLWALRLKPTTQPGELPTPDGSPWQITSGKGAWHVHAGGWSRDASAVVYSRDKDFGDIQVSQRPK